MRNSIRNASRGVIFVDGKLLLIKYRDRDGEFYVCVGGGQKAGEICSKISAANVWRRSTVRWR